MSKLNFRTPQISGTDRIKCYLNPFSRNRIIVKTRMDVPKTINVTINVANLKENIFHKIIF